MIAMKMRIASSVSRFFTFQLPHMGGNIRKITIRIESGEQKSLVYFPLDVANEG